MKGPMNPQLEVGDNIVCYHMEGETGVTPGTKGIVRKITSDPFERDGLIILVDWENGSSLSLLSTTDLWKKIPKENVNENANEFKFIKDSKDVFKYFDWRWFRTFLKDLRDTGIINMFECAPLIYAGKEHVDRYYGEGKEEDEDFQKFLDDCDVARDKLTNGVVQYMLDNDKDLENIDMVNKFARHFSQKILGMFIGLSQITGRVN